VQKPDHVTSSSAVNAEIAQIRRDDRQGRVQFAKPNEAEVGQIWISVGLTLCHFSQPGEVIGNHKSRRSGRNFQRPSVMPVIAVGEG
jgi:hypothetical protein